MPSTHQRTCIVGPSGYSLPPVSGEVPGPRKGLPSAPRARGRVPVSIATPPAQPGIR